MGKPQSARQKSVGGLTFFLSLLFLVFVAMFAAYSAALLFDWRSGQNLIYFSIGAAAGGLIVRCLFTKRFAVFIHELKHSIVSNLAGNRARSMQIRSSRGHFEYEYTQRTSAYNAFISLAPYWFPLFGLLSVLVAAAMFAHCHILMVMTVGLGMGVDALLNTRDISPRQSDISNIRGGYAVGIAYIFFINMAILGVAANWVLAGLGGLEFMLTRLWLLGLHALQRQS